MKTLFRDHLNQVVANTHKIMESNNLDVLFIESGYPDYYFMDDQPTVFRSNPHFLYFCPDMGPGHILKLEKCVSKPKLYFHIPFDFWHETSSLKGEFWEDFFEIEVIGDTHSQWNSIINSSKSNAIISPNPKVAIESGCKVASPSVISALDWNRSSKTPYEIECLSHANKIAAKGHKAAKKAFLNGKSEIEIFNNYLTGAGIRESELPYGNIVALDKNSAILHYQFPKNKPNGKTFLIDAGARFHGYCADITRTWTRDDVDGRFKRLIELIEQQQFEQIAMVKPGAEYIDIHRKAYDGVAQALKDVGILKVGVSEAIEAKIPFTFFPHGVGHPLGLQVHDVGGKQLDASGKMVGQPEDFPYLRTLRTIQANDVLTIEPGLYFIPLLLEKLKKERPSSAEMLDWNIIEKMIPFGGIRIEDNIVACPEGPKNLTRPWLP